MGNAAPNLIEQLYLTSLHLPGCSLVGRPGEFLEMMMSPNWYDRAMQELEQQHFEGFIDDEEFRQGVRLLNEELREEVEEDANDLYRARTGDW